MASPFPNPRRITVGHSPNTTGNHAEPGVDVLVDNLESKFLYGGNSMKRASIATHTSVPTSNNEPGRPALDTIPGSGIVMPGGANIYYLDLAPGAASGMHRTISTDYVFVLKGTLTVIAPPAATPFDVIEDRALYAAGETVEAVVREGDVVVQRGSMHTLANTTKEWVRLLAVVLAAEPVRIDGKELGEKWLK